MELNYKNFKKNCEQKIYLTKQYYNFYIILMINDNDKNLHISI